MVRLSATAPVVHIRRREHPRGGAGPGAGPSTGPVGPGAGGEDWQGDRSLRRGLLHMLNAQIGCDVWFEVPIRTRPEFRFPDLIPGPLEAPSSPPPGPSSRPRTRYQPEQDTDDDSDDDDVDVVPPKRTRHSTRSRSSSTGLLVWEEDEEPPRKQIKREPESGDEGGEGPLGEGPGLYGTPVEGDREKIGAHRNILTARSSVFQTMLDDRWHADNCVIQIDDLDASAFKDLLRYFYSDHIWLTDANILPMIYAASKYMATHFYTSSNIRRYIDHFLCVPNSCVLLNEAVKYGVTVLRDACLHFIATRAHDVFFCPQFFALDAAALGLLLDFPVLLGMSEKLILEAFTKWVCCKGLLEEREITGLFTCDSDLGKLRYKIRLPLMSLKECIKFLSQSKLYSAEEKVYLFNFLAKKSDHMDEAEKCHIIKNFSMVKRLFVESYVDRDISPHRDEFALQSATDFLYFTIENGDLLLTKVVIYYEKFDYYSTCVLSLSSDTETLTEVVQTSERDDGNFTPVLLRNRQRYVLKASWSGPQCVIPKKNRYQHTTSDWERKFGGAQPSPERATRMTFRPSRRSSSPPPVSPTLPPDDEPEKYHNDMTQVCRFNFTYASLPLTSSSTCRFYRGNRGVFEELYYVPIPASQ